MRRKDREVTDFDKIIEIIDECPIIRIGMAAGNFPYIVPLNFSYTVDRENKKVSFYIHGAMAGRKYELLTANPYCSFEMDVNIKMDILPEHHDITTRYKSVMGEATVTAIEGEEKVRVIEDIILGRYKETKGFDYNKAMVERTAIFRLDVISMTGKANPLNGGPDV
ncbi:MAG: pyridoxamine 5'-phosphate oxidase family protein [Spirochaetales bacterium]|nr:pyridoxamine 5'-phosphate oxidase family protein [Spirochaetales bacterium]